jgi:diketogulonate reductase-like aldo/keto reductase
MKQIPQIGLGMFGYQNVKSDIELLDQAIDMGYTLFDTAEMYIGSEEALGTALRNHNIKPYIISKINQENTNSESDIIEHCLSSRKKLNVDMIDSYLLHGINHNLSDNQLLTIIKTLNMLQEIGVIGSYGYTTISPMMLKRMKYLEQVFDKNMSTVYQARHSICRRVEEETLFIAKDFGMHLISASPLGGTPNGLLNVRGHFDSFEKRIVSLTEQLSCSSQQIALCWLRSIGSISIPRAKNAKHLKDNIDSLQLMMTQDQLNFVQQAAR